MMTVKATKGEPFFYYFSGFLLLTVVFAFSVNILLGKYHLSSPLALVIIHGVSMLLWYALLFSQSRLVRIENIQTHRQLGMTSIALAVTIVITGIMISISKYKGEGNAFLVFGNFTAMFLFIIFYGLALKNRFSADIHKRLMVCASIAMLSPALARIVRILGINDFLTGPFWLLFMIVLPIYDYKKFKKVRKITWLATGALIVMLFVTVPIGSSEGWANLVASIFGNK